VVLLAIFWYSKKRGLIGPGSRVAPPKPPEILARERLENLKRSNYSGTNNYQAYYVELSDILRRYLEGRYLISAPDKTTAELSKELKLILERSDVASLRDFLERSDMIKFAKASPDIREMEQDWELIKDFVERTTPVRQESEKTAPDDPLGIKNTAKKGDA
jgi:hypothetical protein